MGLTSNLELRVSQNPGESICNRNDQNRFSPQYNRVLPRTFLEAVRGDLYLRLSLFHENVFRAKSHLSLTDLMFRLPRIVVDIMRGEHIHLPERQLEHVFSFFVLRVAMSIPGLDWVES